jgi:putative iron-dependent peroxidase
MSTQPAILSPAPPAGRFVTLGLRGGADPRAALARLADARWDDGTIVGVGAPLALAVGRAIPGLRPFPAITGAGSTYPSTQGALWLSLGGADAAELLLAARALVRLAGDDFYVEEDVAAFRYGAGRDLSGFEDGTENPKGEHAVAAAIVAGAGAGLDGGSFVAAQRWVHDLARLERLDGAARDALIGRAHDGNEELADAPPSAHVKRAAQESFAPPAFMLRRSLPWGDTREHGLYFVAYGATLDPFERVLRRMAGLDDGIVDGLARFTRAVSGGYYFCPPRAGGRLDLSRLGV